MDNGCGAHSQIVAAGKVTDVGIVNSRLDPERVRLGGGMERALDGAALMAACIEESA